MASGEQLRLTILGSSTDRGAESLNAFHNRLYSPDGSALVKVCGEMALTGGLDSLDLNTDIQPIDELNDSDLIKTLLDETKNGMELGGDNIPILSEAMDKDEDLNKAIDLVRSQKPDTPEISLARRIYNLNRLRVFGKVALGPQLSLVAPKTKNGPLLADGPSSSLSVADIAKIA